MGSFPASYSLPGRGLVLPAWFFLSHNTYDFASRQSIRLVCPAACWIAVYLHALDGHIKLNLPRAEAIISLLRPFSLLWLCLPEGHWCPLHCGAVVLVIALTQSSSASTSWGPCLLPVCQIHLLCSLSPATILFWHSFCFFRIAPLGCVCALCSVTLGVIPV